MFGIETAGLDTGLTFLLVFAILCACAFEFINGFHDTANAVATVIYTHSLKPQYAVILSGFLNFAGVFFGGISVAMSIINLLPLELLVNQNIYDSMGMVLALLITAIGWNLGTWYYGIPCSSSHTLIGSILGVGIGFALLPEGNINNVNWTKAYEVGLSLVISPLFGFGMTVLLMLLLVNLVKDQKLFQTPPAGETPPWWIRGILILTCSGVSFSHGSNDGQKGVGLIMLILIGLLPTQFALQNYDKADKLRKENEALQTQIKNLDLNKFPADLKAGFESVSLQITELNTHLGTEAKNQVIPENQRFAIRKDILTISRNMNKYLENDDLPLDKNQKKELKANVATLRTYTDYAPTWVILLISLSLGTGTMIGWKRIVKTIGEKIGKEHLTYAQGACSEIVAASTIGVSTFLGLPVSTTHVLSSGIAGSMVASKGLANLQSDTIRSIALAWILTLPVCIIGSAILFLVFRTIL